MTLFDAIENGDLRELRNLMRSGIDLELLDEESGIAPLTLAAECGRLDMVHILLRAGVDPNWGGALTPLEAAALEGHLDVAQTLIKASADVNRPVADGFTPLITAASSGHLDIVRLLLDAGAEPKVLDDEGESALGAAKKEGHKEVVRLLEEKASNGHRGRRDESPKRRLFRTLEERDPIGLKEFLLSDSQIRLETTNRDGLTALSIAAGSGHLGLVKTLLEAGAEVDDGGEKAPILAAAEEHHAPVVEVLIEAGANVDVASSETKTTPLMIAAARGDVETLRLLLDANADVKRQDVDGRDALWHAAHEASAQTFLLLVSHFDGEEREKATKELESQVGTRERVAKSASRLTDLLLEEDYDRAKQLLANGLIDPDGFDEEGRTALMLAARAGRPDVVRMLTGAGASFELYDDTLGQTALIFAVRAEARDAPMTVAVLAAAGADLDRPSRDGRPPLMHAVDAFVENDEADESDVDRFTAVVEKLILMGCSVEAKDRGGRTTWQSIQDRLLAVGTPVGERRRLGRAQRALERNGARTSGDTWLMDFVTAVAEGRSGQVRELLEELEGDIESLGDISYLDMAAENADWEVVHQLIEAGLDIDTPSPTGETILMQAARQGHQAIVEQLVVAGADVKAKSEDGQTAAKIAAAEGHEDLAKFLQNKSKGRAKAKTPAKPETEAKPKAKAKKEEE